MSPDALFHAGIGFSVLLALFLGGCALTHFLGEPADDPFSDGACGDWAHVPADFKTLFHATQNIEGEQQDHA